MEVIDTPVAAVSVAVPPTTPASTDSFFTTPLPPTYSACRKGKVSVLYVCSLAVATVRTTVPV